MLVSQKAKEAARNPNQILSSLITLHVLFTHLLPVSPAKRRQSVPKGAWTEWTWVPCSPRAAWLWLPRSLPRSHLWQTLLLSHLCKDPRLCCTPGLALGAGCQHHLGRSCAAGGHSGCTAALNTSAPQARQDKWGVCKKFCSAHTENWVRFKEWHGYFWSRCQDDSVGPVSMLKSDLWVCLCSSIFIQHNNNTEVNQGKFLKYILDSWYPWGNYFDLILLKVLPQSYWQSSFVAYKFIRKNACCRFSDQNLVVQVRGSVQLIQW